MLLSRHTSSQGILAADGKTVEKLVELPELIIEQHPIYLDPSSWYIAKYSEYRALHDNGRSRCGHWAGTDSGCIQAVVDSSLLGSWYVLILHRAWCCAWLDWCCVGTGNNAAAVQLRDDSGDDGAECNVFPRH